MSGAAGVRKPNESQKATAFWKMKAAKDRREDFYDPERKDNVKGRNKTRLELWEEHLKDPIEALDEALKCDETSCWLNFGPRLLVEVVFNGLWTRGLRHGSRDVEKAAVGKGLALFGSVVQRAFAHSIQALERSREVWAAW